MRFASILTILLVFFAISFSQQVSNGQAEQTAKKIESYLDKIEAVGFYGSVLVDINGEKVLSKGYGFRDESEKLKNTPYTIFDIGSLTKQFTAAAILKLEMQGKLSTDDIISKYFENVPADKSGITIHELLRHASGLKSVVGGDYDKITQDAFIDSVLNSPLKFEPGTAFSYSNIGYSLLAMIIEKVSGVSYEEYLYENLWKPAQMESTGYTRPNFESDMIANGYNPMSGNLWGKPTDKAWDGNAPYWHLKGNGGILSTTEDLYKWHLALLTDSILSNEAKEKYFYPKLRDNESSDSYYAYGWDVHKTIRNTKLISHDGFNRIFYADFFRFVDEGVTIITLTNKALPDFTGTSMEISRIIFEPNYKPVIPAADNETNRNFTAEIIKILKEKGLKAAIKAFKERTAGAQLIESSLNVEGYDLIKANNFKQAIDIFLLNVYAYPDSFNAFDSLGEAYMDDGNNKLAIENYKKSLELNRGNENAVEMLQKLGNK